MLSRPDFSLSTPNHLRIRVDEHTLSHALLQGLTIAFVSDVHLRPSMDAARLCALIAGLNAELILFGGDFADSRCEALRLLRALQTLQPKLGMFAVPGNNDVEAFGSVQALSSALRESNVELLVNRCTPLRWRGARLSLAGLDDALYGQPNADGLFSVDADYRILLSHYPILRSIPAPSRPDLMLCGHTHGGQFNLFGFTPYSIGFERLGSRRRCAPALVSGMKRFGHTSLLVSKGVGMSRISLRVGVHPEIHRIEFC